MNIQDRKYFLLAGGRRQARGIALNIQKIIQFKMKGPETREGFLVVLNVDGKCVGESWVASVDFNKAFQPIAEEK